MIVGDAWCYLKEILEQLVQKACWERSDKLEGRQGSRGDVKGVLWYDINAQVEVHGEETGGVYIVKGEGGKLMKNERLLTFQKCCYFSDLWREKEQFSGPKNYELMDM